jgi:hypothetical protein
MIPNNTETVEVSGNIDADVTGQFTVDENSLGKIMSVLTNLYSDPERAVVREYLTNALDAQIEAQELDPNYVWRPIDVTTPSHWAKEYKVRDYGIGMSVDDIKEIYSKYGKSTKETSNAVTGMLGLGSKCALTYTGQFTITGFKNGVRTRAIVSKDDNDIPVFMIVDTRASDEPNGVEISVPVRDRNSFETKTAEFLRWWKPGQVLVNGNEPKHHSYKEVKPGIHLIERDTSSYSYRYEAPQSYVVMGNVPYEVDAEYVPDALRNAYLGFVAYVDMGAVDFPPSREKLFYNNRTKAVLTNVGQGLFDAILKEKLDEIVNAPDHRTAWLNYQNLDGHFKSAPKAKDLKYKGLAFIDRVGHNHMVLDWDWQGHGQIAERQWISMLGAMGGTLVVTGVPQGTKPTSYFKKKVKFYIDQQGIDAHNALLVLDDIDEKWLDWLPRIDADTIKAIKLPKNGPVGPKVETPYEYYTIDSKNQVSYQDSLVVPCPAGKQLVYISPQDMKETYRKSGTSADVMIKQLGKDYVLVVLGKNRFEKFLRSHPTAITAAKAVQEKVDAYVAAATPEEFTVGKLSYGEKNFMEKVDVSLINDPELVKLAKVVQGKNLTMNYQNAQNLAAWASRASIYPKVPEAKKSNAANPCKKYALLDHVGARQMRHLCLYVNAVYAETQANP